MRQFDSDADVRRHFFLRVELGRTPDPPAKLWERIEAWRTAVSTREKVQHPLQQQPDLHSLEFPEITFKRRTHPVKLGERVVSIADVRPPAKKTYKLKGAL